MQKILAILGNRNFILVSAVVLGLAFGNYAHLLKEYTLYFLAILMIFSTTGITLKSLLPLRKALKNMLWATFLNYFVLSGSILLLAWLLMPDRMLFFGFVVIASSPPGVAIIPFAHILKGDVNYSIVGVSGAFLLAVVLAPAIIALWGGGASIGLNRILLIMLQIIVLPLLLSRLLLLKGIRAKVEKVRGKVVNWGFALIIFIAVGVNREVFFSQPKIILLCSAVLACATFGLGTIYEQIAKKHQKAPRRITDTLQVTVKSSGYAAATALSLYGEKAAIPSAVLSVMVLAYLLFLSFRKSKNA